MTYSIILNSMTKALCNLRKQEFAVRRAGLWLGSTLAVLTLVTAGTLVSYAEVKIEQKDLGSKQPTTTNIRICDTDEKDAVNIRVDVPGFYNLDLRISPECKTDRTKNDNGATKKEKRE
jgi:hypothetical protein